MKAGRLGYLHYMAEYDKPLGKVNSIPKLYFVYVHIYHLIKRTLATTESKDKPLLNEYDLLIRKHDERLTYDRQTPYGNWRFFMIFFVEYVFNLHVFKRMQ